LNLKIDIGSLTLKNPVLTASGTFGYGEEFAEFYDLSRLGGIVAKGISIKPKEGNPPPRIAETPCGMLNSIGLQNVGLKRFIKEKLPILRGFNTVVIANILGNSISEYVRLAVSLEEAGVDAIEINVSCPNVKKGGIEFGTEPKTLRRLLFKVRGAVTKPLIVKLSPRVQDIAEFAKIAETEGIDAISAINTIPAMAVDIRTKKPVLANKIGGLSGPAIKPIALRMVYEVSRVVEIPVIGIGGIMSADDAIEFLLAGASAVAVGTANFINPRAGIDVLEGIEKYMSENNIDDIRELIKAF